MKLHAKLLLLAAALCAALLPSTRAQLVTYETTSGYAGTNQYSLPNNSTAGETFSNILGISSLTYNFFNNGTSNATNLTATFAEWNGSGGALGFTNTANYNTLVNFGTFTVPASTSWTTLTNGNGTFNTYAQTFSFGSLFLTDPNATYALLLTNTSGATTTFGVGFVSNSFAYGDASLGLGSFSQDYTFAQIVVVPNDGSHVVPVPEASTVAALVGGALAVGLAALRIRQRRQLVVSPVAA